MHVTCSQTHLAEALALASEAVPSHPTLPILSRFLLRAEGSDVTLRATDLAIGIVARLAEPDVRAPGSLALPAGLLTDLVKRLPAGPLELRADDHSTLEIRAQHTVSHIRGSDPEQYPALNRDTYQEPFFVEAGELKAAIKASAFAAAKDDARPVFCSVLLEQEGERLFLVAADSFRLARDSIAMTGQLAGPLLVPAKALADLARVLPAEGTVECAVSEKGDQVLFATRRVDFFTRLVEGAFPAYRRMYPERRNIHLLVTAQTETLRARVRCAVPFSDGGRSMRLRIEPGKAGEWDMHIETANSEIGDSAHQLPVEADGAPMSLLLNSDYFKEALDTMSSPRVRLAIQSPRQALLLTPVAEDGGERVRDSILMPLFLKD